MTYQDVLDALDSILEKLRGNNSELCEKLGIDPEDPSITGEEGEEDDVEGDADVTDDGAADDADSDETADADASDSDEEQNVDEDTPPGPYQSTADAEKAAALAQNAEMAAAHNEVELEKAAQKTVDDIMGKLSLHKPTIVNLLGYVPTKVKPQPTKQPTTDVKKDDGFGAKLRAGFDNTKNWAKENPKTALAAAAGTGLAAGLLGAAMAGDDDDEEDESTVVNESGDKESDIFAESDGVGKNSEPAKSEAPKAEPSKATEPKAEEPKTSEQKDVKPEAKDDKKPEAKDEKKPAEGKDGKTSDDAASKEDKKDDAEEKKGFFEKNKTAIAATGAGLAGLAVGGIAGNHVGKKKERKRAEVGMSEGTEDQTVSDDLKNSLELASNPMKAGMSDDTKAGVDAAVDAGVEPPPEDDSADDGKSAAGNEGVGILGTVGNLGKDVVTGTENLKAGAEAIGGALERAGGDVRATADSLNMSVEEFGKAANEFGVHLNTTADTFADTGAQLGADAKAAADTVSGAVDRAGANLNTAADTVGKNIKDTGDKLGSDLKTAALGGAAILGGSMLGSSLIKRRRRRS